MKLTFLILIILAFFAIMPGLQAQVSINSDGSDPDASAMLEVKSNNKGLLIPRLTTAQRNALGAIAVAGLIVYDTNLDQFFFYDGTGWLEASTGNLWKTDGTKVFLHDSLNFVGIGTSIPSRKLEIKSAGWRPLRLSTTSNGPFMEFVGSDSPDWTIGMWSGVFYLSSSTDDFATWADQFMFTTSALRPVDNDTKTLGQSGARWSNIYSIDGNYSGLLSGSTATFSGLLTAGSGYFTGNVGIGTSSPARKLEVNGPWQTARISSTSSGSSLEFVSTTADDWAVSTWAGNMALIWSDNDFSTKTDQFYFGTSAFWPWTDNTKTLGTSSKQWSTLYSIDGLFSGRAAVGTQSLLGAFHVHDPNSQLATMYITPATTGSEDSSRIFLAEDDDGSFGMYWQYDGVQNQMGLWGYSGGTDYGPHILVNRSSGYMSLGGDFATGYRLSVSGKIICTELRVDFVADWPDYVFREDYQLMPITHLRKFISKNGHLPNVPAADQIEKSGMDVGKMQTLMMEKIEELTLYILKQQEQIDALQEEIDRGRAVVHQ